MARSAMPKPRLNPLSETESSEAGSLGRHPVSNRVLRHHRGLNCFDHHMRLSSPFKPRLSPEPRLVPWSIPSRHAVLSVLAVLLPSAAVAQEWCVDVLQNDIRDYWANELEVVNTAFAHTEMCSRYQSNRDNQTNLGISIPIKGVPVGVSFGSDQVSAYGRAFCEDSGTFEQRDLQQAGFRALVNPDLVQSFETCLELEEEGVVIREESPLPGVVSLTIEVNIPSTGGEPIYRGFRVAPEGGASCVWVDSSDSPPPPGSPMAAGEYGMVCELANNERSAAVSLLLSSAPMYTTVIGSYADLQSAEGAALSSSIDQLTWSVERLVAQSQRLAGLTAWMDDGFCFMPPSTLDRCPEGFTRFDYGPRDGADVRRLNDGDGAWPRGWNASNSYSKIDICCT